MSPTVSEAVVAPELQLLYAPIQTELAGVEQILRDELRSHDPFVDELVRYSSLLGGKRLRPALLLLAAKACGEVNRDHLVLAAVVEMIHTATLVHDDVLDEADMRRHLATVNSRWDNEASVLLGDYLFTHAFYLASTLKSTLACRVIGRSTNVVCEGEIRQKGSRSRFTLSEDEYLEIISAKTAELCACSCHLGAHYAMATEDDVVRLTNYGRDLGIAFQIADDLLDVLGDEDVTGKSLGTDMEKEKPTLPLIRVLELASDSDRAEVLSIIRGESEHRRRDLQPFFERFDALNYARDKARWFANRAAEQLATLPDSPARQILQQLPEFVVARSS